MDVKQPASRLQRRPSIHYRRNLTDDQKKLVQESAVIMSKATSNKLTTQISPNVVGVQNQDSSSDDDNSRASEDTSIADSENESENSRELSRDRSNLYIGECSRELYDKTETDSVSRCSSEIIRNRIPKAAVQPRSQEKLPSNLKKQLDNDRNVKPFKTYGILFMLFFCVLVLVTCNTNNTFEEKSALKLLQDKFPTQDKFLWLAFKSGAEDVLTQNKPATFILIYNQSSEKTLRELLPELQTYALCFLTNCGNDPIILTPDELNTSEILNDYGKLIEQYRGKLQDVGVMIIKNLEQVRGTSAQAFHSFCDEFTPLVERSLFIFTMKLENFSESTNKMKFIEEYFRRKWTDIKPDVLNPLITRITSMVLEVKA